MENGNASERRFSCFILDGLIHENFSAQVTVRKVFPIRKSLQHGKIDLADAFITPIAGQTTSKIHHHFVVYNYAGEGLYIVRDRNPREPERRFSCTVWDLGNFFGNQMTKLLRELA